MELPVCSVCLLVGRIAGMSGFWIGSKPGDTLGVTLVTGVGFSDTLGTAAGMFLVAGAGASGSVGGKKSASCFSAVVLLLLRGESGDDGDGL